MTIGAVTFANAAPSRDVEGVNNIKVARDNVQVNHVRQARANEEPIVENVVRDIQDDLKESKVHRRTNENHPNNDPKIQRRANWIWAEFTDDWGNYGDGYHNLYSSESFYVPTDKTKIKIHASDDQYDSFRLEQSWQNGNSQYLYQPYDGQLIDFWLSGTWFKIEQAYGWNDDNDDDNDDDDDDKKKSR